MKHTLSEQIKAIQEAREIVGHISQDGRLHIPIPSEEKLTEIYDKLNDAGSYLAALNLTKDLIDKGREEYWRKILDHIADWLETPIESSKSDVYKSSALSMSYDELAKAHRRIEELEGALKKIVNSNDSQLSSMSHGGWVAVKSLLKQD